MANYRPTIKKKPIMFIDENDKINPNLKLYHLKQKHTCEWCDDNKKKDVYGMGFHGGILLCKPCITKHNAEVKSGK